MRKLLVFAVILLFGAVAEAAPLTVECRVSSRAQSGFEAVLKKSLEAFIRRNFPGTRVRSYKFELVPVAGRTGQRISVDDLNLWGIGANGALTLKDPKINTCALEFIANIRAHVNGTVYPGTVGPFLISGSYEVVR